MISTLAALTALAVFGGIALIVLGLRRHRPAPGTPTTTLLIPNRARRGVLGSLTRTQRLAFIVALAAGALIWLFTGWVLAIIALPAAAIGLPALLGSGNAGASIDRLEAMEEWTRSLSGVLTVGVGLEQALVATLRSAPAPIREEVTALVSRLNGRWTTAAALRAFADDLNDATGDMLAYQLTLAAKRRGQGLASVLNRVASTVADEVRIRRAIEADRAKPRATARYVTIITAVVIVVLVLFRPEFMAPYKTPVGTLIALALLAAYSACLVWMQRLARGKPLPRFLDQKAETIGARG